MVKNYSHLVSIVERDGKPYIRIDRLIKDKKDFMTEIEIPISTEKEQWDIFDKIAEVLGKTLCIDSPKIRSLLKIDDETSG